MPLEAAGSGAPASGGKPGEGAGNGAMSADIKDIIGESVNLEFKTDEEALKYVKDNNSYVGKFKNYSGLIGTLEQKLGGQDALKRAMESLVGGQPVDQSAFVPREQYETEKFFDKHPEFGAPELQETLLAMRKSTGKSLPEVINSETFKNLYGTYKAGKDFEGSKSVLESNPRLGVASNKITEARELLKTGNKSAAEDAALAAVLPIMRGET